MLLSSWDLSEVDAPCPVEGMLPLLQSSGRVEQVRVVLERPRAVRWSMGPDFRNNGFLRKKGLEGSAVGQEHTCAAPPYQALWTVRAGRCMEASS